MGLQIRVVRASTSREIDAAFATFVGERPDALFVGPSASSAGKGVRTPLMEVRKKAA
jgi:hypothetical protein